MPAFNPDSEFGAWEKTDISPSKLKQFNECPKKFYYKYVRREDAQWPSEPAGLESSRDLS